MEISIRLSGLHNTSTWEQGVGDFHLNPTPLLEGSLHDRRSVGGLQPGPGPRRPQFPLGVGAWNGCHNEGFAGFRWPPGRLPKSAQVCRALFAGGCMGTSHNLQACFESRGTEEQAPYDPRTILPAWCLFHLHGSIL